MGKSSKDGGANPRGARYCADAQNDSTLTRFITPRPRRVYKRPFITSSHISPAIGNLCVLSTFPPSSHRASRINCRESAPNRRGNPIGTLNGYCSNIEMIVVPTCRQRSCYVASSDMSKQSSNGIQLCREAPSSGDPGHITLEYVVRCQVENAERRLPFAVDVSLGGFRWISLPRQ